VDPEDYTHIGTAVVDLAIRNEVCIEFIASIWFEANSRPVH